MKEKIVQVKVSMEFKEYLKLNYSVGLRQLNFLLFIIVPLVLCNASLIVVYLTSNEWARGNTKPLIVIAAISTVLLLIFGSFVFFIYRNSKRNMENLPFLKQQVSYIFSQNQIESKGDSFESRLGWDMFSGAREVAGFILLHNHNGTALPIPVRCFRDQEEIKEKQD
ncbi:MAG: YcxB family protein, partial [Saprospiraceae bacterium]|nr:YcxB family protein [Pyrinomonadaceae bacterium]